MLPYAELDGRPGEKSSGSFALQAKMKVRWLGNKCQTDSNRPRNSARLDYHVTADRFVFLMLLMLLQ